MIARNSKDIEDEMVNDVLYRVVFGHLERKDVLLLSGQGSVLGLRTAILYHLYMAPYSGTRNFQDRLGYRTTGTIDRAIAVLQSLGLIAGKPLTKAYVITAKGRTLLDIVRRGLYELREGTSSEEFRQLLGYLGVNFDSSSAKFTSPLTDEPFGRLLYDAGRAETQFNVDLLERVDAESLRFHEKFDWNAYVAGNEDMLPSAADAGFSLHGDP